MSLENIVTATNLGSEFSVGGVQSGKIRLRLGEGLVFNAQGELEIDLTVNNATIYEEFYASASDNGTTQSWARNCTITRTAVGRWDINFLSAHPDGSQYAINIETQEESGLRDAPDITVVQGSKNVNGFSVQITTGDNGGTADVYVDAPWCCSVNAPRQMVVDVAVN